MSYTISVSEDGNYITLKVMGEITSESAMKQNLEAHALGKKLEISCYFVDLTESRNVETTTKNYTFAYEDMNIQAKIDRSACVVMLVSPEDHSHDFIETVLRNTGQNVTLFRNRELAIQYFLQEKSTRNAT